MRGGGAHARGARCWGRRLELRKDARFKEINRGRWLGLTREDINRDFPDDMAAFLRDPEWKGHGGESYSDLSARVLAGLDDAMAAAREQARPVARGCWWGGKGSVLRRARGRAGREAGGAREPHVGDQVYRHRRHGHPPTRTGRSLRRRPPAARMGPHRPAAAPPLRGRADARARGRLGGQDKWAAMEIPTGSISVLDFPARGRAAEVAQLGVKPAVCAPPSGPAPPRGRRARAPWRADPGGRLRRGEGACAELSTT